MRGVKPIGMDETQPRPAAAHVRQLKEVAAARLRPTCRAVGLAKAEAFVAAAARDNRCKS
jgi:hypothetical protein